MPKKAFEPDEFGAAIVGLVVGAVAIGIVIGGSIVAAACYLFF